MKHADVRSRVRLLVALGAASIALSACGGGSSGSLIGNAPTSGGGSAPTARPTSRASSPPPRIPTPTPSPTTHPCGCPTKKPTPRPTPTPTPIYTAAPADVPIAAAPAPTPFDPSSPLSLLGQTDLPNTISQVDIPRRMLAHRYATAGYNDHEGEGVFLFGSAPPYNAFFGLQTAYEALQKPFPYPTSGVTGEEQIFAPTMHPAWSSCLENSSYYNSTAAGETAHFTVFNFCLSSPTFIFDANVNAQFVSEYVRRGPQRRQMYVSEIFTPDQQITGTSRWYSILYNFSKHRYDIIISAPAIGSYQADAFGWSIIEPYAAAGPCPSVAPVMASGLALHNTQTGAWDSVTPSLAGGASTEISVEGGSNNPCLLGDSTGPPSMNFLLLQPNSQWQVTSPLPQ